MPAFDLVLRQLNEPIFQAEKREDRGNVDGRHVVLLRLVAAEINFARQLHMQRLFRADEAVGRARLAHRPHGLDPALFQLRQPLARRWVVLGTAPVIMRDTAGVKKARPKLPLDSTEERSLLCCVCAPPLHLVCSLFCALRLPQCVEQPHLRADRRIVVQPIAHFFANLGRQTHAVRV